MGEEQTIYSRTLYINDNGEWRNVGTISSNGITLSSDGPSDYEKRREALGTLDFTIISDLKFSRSETLAFKALVWGGKYRKNYEKAQRRSRNNSRRKK